MGRLILLRHGQSVFNQENRFTGFLDVELSEKGRNEAASAGHRLKGQHVDVIFQSALKRARETADIVASILAIESVERISAGELNERHYGELQGLNKDEVREKFGAEQVRIWRRSFDVSPPGGESLKDTCARVIPYFERHVLPRLESGENVLIVAHGNSLRGLVMALEKMDEQAIVALEIPTGVPISYDIDTNGSVHNKIEYLCPENS